VTTERRYQVFISSTYDDLIEERKEISKALLNMNCFPAGMENFPGVDEDQIEFAKQEIDTSDFYVVISAGRYGSIHPKDNISFTEIEYDYAIKSNKPIIRLLHSDPLNELKGRDLEHTEEGRKQLERFRTRLTKESNRLCKFWNNPSQLREGLLFALNWSIRNSGATGWIKFGEGLDEQLAQEVKLLRSEFQNSIKGLADQIGLLRALLNNDERLEDDFQDTSLEHQNRSWYERDRWTAEKSSASAKRDGSDQ